jgi:hypothetical protein
VTYWDVNVRERGPTKLGAKDAVGNVPGAGHAPVEFGGGLAEGEADGDAEGHAEGDPVGDAVGVGVPAGKGSVHHTSLSPGYSTSVSVAGSVQAWASVVIVVVPPTNTIGTIIATAATTKRERMRGMSRVPP